MFHAELLRILVIDDDDIAREHIASTLASAGNVVLQLPSAIGATRVISHEHIDVVVLDVLMPDLDGDKLARLLRKSGRHANLAIILISGRPASELEPLAVAAGADAVVSKSDVRSKLASTVRAAHRGRSVSQHLSR
jgi:CheY-like chemotaxis protein